MQSPREVFHRATHYWEAHEHTFGMGALIIGFILDLLFANRPDSVWDNVLLVVHLLNASAIIIFLNLKAPRTENEHAVEPVLTFLMQFSFGALASNLLVLYGHSGTFTASAIFIAILFAMLIGNEFLKNRYEQLRFNIAVYYLLLFTYLTMAVPTFIFHAVNVWVFLASGLLSLVIMVPFLLVLRFAIKRGKKEKRLLWEARIIIGVIFCAFTLAYFFNIIPPVPLSVKGIGIYHSVQHTAEGNYVLTYEPSPWFIFWRETSATYTYNGSPAFCFSSVFAPTDLDTPIYHQWEHYNDSTKKWDVLGRISFPISGGRAQGYRGFSTVSNLSAGQWRCDVETQSGQLIGRISFTVVNGPTPTLSTKTL